MLISPLSLSVCMSMVTTGATEGSKTEEVPIEREKRGQNKDVYPPVVNQLGGGFKYFLCSSLLGEMIQFD